MKRKELKKFIGKQILYYRKKNGLTQEELTIKIRKKYPEIDLTHSTISSYERGFVDIGIYTLFALADVLEITIVDLLPVFNQNHEKMMRTSELLNKFYASAETLSNEELNKFYSFFTLNLELFKTLK